MLKSTYLTFALVLICLTSIAQKGSQIKECRISSGLGFAGPTENIASLGTDTWLQLDYKLLESVSIATEFDFMRYKQLGYYPDRPSGPNEITVYNNNFSLLLKYHFPSKSKLKISLASGWTYSIVQEDYYIYEKDNTTEHWLRNISSFSEYRIPFLAELECPITNKLNLQMRAKYNLHPQDGGSYSGGLGLSLKL